MFNSYLGNNQYGNQFYPAYGQNYTPYQSVQSQLRQNFMQPQQVAQTQDVPFTEVRFGTFDEAKAYIVPPLKAVMFINRNNSEFYIKSADNMGEPTLEAFKYSRVGDKPTEPIMPEFDPKDFVKTGDLKGFLTFEDTKNFLTKDDLKGIDTKLDNLQKQIKINEILKGDDKSGK